MADYDVVIIGGGPGGYVAAIRAAQLGLNVAVVEKDRLGGVCLNWGCIPTKSLLTGADLLGLFRRSEQFGIVHADLRADLSLAVDRSREVSARMVKGVEFLLSKNRVAVLPGTAALKSPNEVVVEPTHQLLSAENIIIATGAVARSLPGVEIDRSAVITSREALELRRLPASILIVGGGPIGVEFGYLYRTYGSEVTIIEMLDHLLPSEDEEVSALLERSFKQQGIRCLTRTGVQGVQSAKGKAKVGVSVDGRDSELEAEKLLMAVGMAANSDGLGLEALGVERRNGFIKVDGAMRTNVPGIYAIGDVTGNPMLAHVASEQGVIAAERIAGLAPPAPDYESMPRCTYCRPQVASCGLTEAQARERGHDVRTGRFPFRANGKAAAAGEDQGFVKVVMDADHGRLLGFHIIGPEATELVAEAALVLRAKGTARDVISTVHAHPTLAESIKEATLLAEGKGLHFFSEPARGEQE